MNLANPEVQRLPKAPWVNCWCTLGWYHMVSQIEVPYGIFSEKSHITIQNTDIVDAYDIRILAGFCSHKFRVYPVTLVPRHLIGHIFSEVVALLARVKPKNLPSLQ